MISSVRDPIKGRIRMNDLSFVARLLRENDNFEILTHNYPDGDTLGCGYGLCQILQSMGKNARVIESGAVAQKYSFLRNGVKEQSFDRGYVVSVDVATESLLGDLACEYEGKIDLCIDHHATNSLGAAHRYVDSQAAAASEIIYELAVMLSVDITPQIADCIYTGISTDTGCFRYTNTTENTHIIAAKMMACGASWQDINTAMFEVKTSARLELERMVYHTLEYACDGKFALIYTTLAMQEKAGIGDDEAEGLASIPRQIEGVLIGVTMREKSDGSFKISVRSNKGANAAEFAARFGGGGHPAAAGCTITGDLETTKRLLIEAAQEML